MFPEFLTLGSPGVWPVWCSLGAGGTAWPGFSVPSLWTRSRTPGHCLTREVELWPGEQVLKAVWGAGQRPLGNYNLSQEIAVLRTQVASQKRKLRHGAGLSPQTDTHWVSKWWTQGGLIQSLCYRYPEKAECCIYRLLQTRPLESEKREPGGRDTWGPGFRGALTSGPWGRGNDTGSRIKMQISASLAALSSDSLYNLPVIEEKLP